MSHKWIHLLMFSVPKVLDRWINLPFHLASFTWSLRLVELKLRAIHLEKPINSLLLEAHIPLSLAKFHFSGLEPLCISAVSIIVFFGPVAEGSKAHRISQVHLYIFWILRSGRIWEPRRWAPLLGGGRQSLCGVLHLFSFSVMAPKEVGCFWEHHARWQSFCPSGLLSGWVESNPTLFVFPSL